MQSFAFFACFTYCLTILLLPCESQSSAEPHDRRDFERIGNESRCNWHCAIVDSDFGEFMKILTTKYRLITLELTFMQRVDEKCLNQTDLDNATKPADIWTWLTNNNQSRGKNISKQSTGPGSVSVNRRFRKSFEGQKKVSVMCDFKQANDSSVNESSSTSISLNDAIAIELLESAATGGNETVLCYKEWVHNGSYTCLNATASEASTLDPQHRGLGIIAILMTVLLTMYFPSILCLFSPTEVNADGRCVIVLNGTCPVGIRSLISNLFSTRYTWGWKFLLISLLLMLMILIILFVEWNISKVFPPSSYRIQTIELIMDNSYILIFGVSFLHALRYVLGIWFKTWALGAQCLTCKLFANKAIIHRGLQEELKQHLHIQPLIVMRLCRYCFNLGREKLSFELTCLNIIMFVVLAPFTLAIIIVMILISFCYSCPLSTFFINVMGKILFMLDPDGYTSETVTHRCCSLLVHVLMVFLIFVSIGPSTASFLFLVFYPTVVSLQVIRGILMGSPDYLPVATLVVVVVFYCWKCYSSFSRKYHNLALNLYKHCGYKTNTQGGDGQQVNTEVDKEPVIPKDIFKKACQDLMPLRESISLLVVKLVTLLTFFSVVFIVIMETPGTTDRAKATATLFTALTPKIIEMAFSKDPGMEELDDEVFDEKVKYIVDTYRSTTENSSDGGDTSAENSGDNNITNTETTV